MKRAVLLTLVASLFCFSFSCGFIVLSPPTGPNPGDSATGVMLNTQDNTVALNWIAPQFILGSVTYDVYFGSTLPDVPSSKDLTTATWKTPALTPGTLYHWQVVARASGQPDAESSKWSFTTAGTANQPPTAPANPVPANTATSTPLGQTLSWSASTDAESETITYDVFFGANSLPSTAAATGLTVTSWTPPTLQISTTYSWKVVAKDAHGDSSATSATWTFTTVGNQPPTAPVDHNPGNGVLNVPLGYILGWQNSTDPENDAISYDIYFGTTLPTTPTATQSGQGATNWPPTLQPSTTYYWKIVAKDATGDSSATSQTWSFTTAPAAATTLTGCFPFSPTDGYATWVWDDRLWAFSQANPGIAIQPTFIVGYAAALQQYAQSGTLPDIFQVNGTTGQYAAASHAADLRSNLGGHLSEFIAGSLVPQGPGGEIYILPLIVLPTHVMYVNTHLLSQLGLSIPTTLAGLLAQKQTIVSAGYVPIQMDNADGWQMQSCLLSTLAERKGGITWFSNAISKKSSATFADQPFVDALTVIKNLSDGGMFPSNINTQGYGTALSSFESGNAVYFIDGGWRTSPLMNDSANTQKSYIGYMAIPDVGATAGGSDSGSISVIVDGYAINSATTKASAAWSFIWCFAGPVGSTILLNHGNGGGQVPAYIVNTTGIVLDPLELKYIAFMQSHPFGWIMDAMLRQDDIGAVLQPEIKQMMAGSKTPQEVATDYAAAVAAHEPAKTWP